MKPHLLFAIWLVTFCIGAAFGAEATPPATKKVPPIVRVENEKLYIPAKSLIQIESYDPTVNTYRVQMLERPMVGPLHTTAENIALAINGIDLATLKKKPSKIVGTQYALDAELVLLFDNEYRDRKEALKKSRKKKAD